MPLQNDKIINRHSEKRTNEEWITTEVNNPNTRFIPVCGSKVFIKSENNFKPAYINRKMAVDYNNLSDLIFLGMLDDRSYFAFEVAPEKAEMFSKLGKFIELRSALPFLDENEANIFLHARAMLYWKSSHKFCGTCGSRNISKEAGNLLVCSNNECGKNHFPRTDPAVIVLVTNGNKCLLGHNSGWPGPRYSTLAGFVEPGETLEDAVRREIFEESGIGTKNIKYFSSQSWPFPSSLMLGFMAESVNDKIKIDEKEIEHADWFSREDIIRNVRNKTMTLPFRISIAFRLIKDWFERESSISLEELVEEK